MKAGGKALTSWQEGGLSHLTFISRGLLSTLTLPPN